MSSSVSAASSNSNAAQSDRNTEASKSSSSEANGRERAASSLEGRGDPRDAAQLEKQSKLFRELMSGKQTTAGQLAELAARADQTALGERALQDPRHRWPGLSDDLKDMSADAAAMLAVEQRVDRGIAVQSSVMHASPDATFAELVEKHVRRALASREVAATRGGEVRIELSDAVMPGMALSLRRTESGWELLAESGNRQSLDKLSRFAPALVERFARASLGDLTVSVPDGA